ncbi:MAG TPA: hypothetical protein VLR70_06555 [Arthrobacter sp.]|nr:hypothetical protein [Arthrobacter sp.]
MPAGDDTDGVVRVGGTIRRPAPAARTGRPRGAWLETTAGRLLVAPAG